MEFKPSQTESVKVPFFEDAKSEDGWQGYATSKSVETLQKEITDCIRRLGGFVSGFQHGRFIVDKLEREGYRIYYSISAPDGGHVPGRLDIAALPVRQRYNNQVKRDKSLRMALYMLRVGLDGSWFMQQLSPGYAPLMPWMLNAEGKTVSELWAESPMMNRLLPPPSSDFVEGEIVS